MMLSAASPGDVFYMQWCGRMTGPWRRGKVASVCKDRELSVLCVRMSDNYASTIPGSNVIGKTPAEARRAAKEIRQ